LPVAGAISEAICAHVADARFDALPEAALAAAKRVLLDATGVMLGASSASEPRAFVEYAAGQGAGPCAILGTGRTASAPLAALANGAMAHALDFEDAFDLAPGHPNASLVPALIALAQAEGEVDGRRFLTALAVGGDIACRVGLSVGKALDPGGWYPPPIVAAYGAAAGAACLLGLGAKGVRNALSLMLCQTTMPGEIKHSAGTELRAVRESFPAQAAVTSALLTRGGVTGFEEPLEGAGGFFALFARGEYDPAALLDGLGEHYWTEQLTFKPWPSCRGTHAAIELALALREEHGLAATDIAEIYVGADGLQRMLIEPLARKQSPATAIDAKFSLPYCTAVALARGRVDLDSFGPHVLADAEILSVAARVAPRFTDRPTWHHGGGGALEIVLRDGRKFAGEVYNALGCPDRPLGDDALRDKFVACTGRAARPLARDEALALADAIQSLEQCDDVGRLFA
jgi:2-methylcitrate dehydratase PrpD